MKKRYAISIGAAAATAAGAFASHIRPSGIRAEIGRIAALLHWAPAVTVADIGAATGASQSLPL